MRTMYFDGTHRTRHPAQTWAAIRPLLARYGITRVADVTGLDDLGIPVTMAVRPLARTLSVAQGKGLTLDAARVSGALEAIEAWHAECAVPTVFVRQAAAVDLDLPYAVTDLEHHAGSLVTERTCMDWVPARSAADGGRVLVPESAVRLGRQLHDDWRLHLPSASTNGLASGNTPSEAIVHALGEVIERHVLSTVTDRPARAQLLDPASVEEPRLATLLEKLRAARVWMELWHLPNTFQVPVMSCHLWREDQAAVVAGGSGAHLDPAVALSRAITEAAQTRLTLITGTREDTAPAAYRCGSHHGPRPATLAALPWPDATRHYSEPVADHEEQAALLTARITDVTGTAPLVVDLTWGPHSQTEISAVKVLAPGLRYDTRHTVPRPRPGTEAT
ncbi:YcaO-like family protein [Streptomyces sp. R21]|uniref:YcaO-like family protein n=1 Tax=Streptomyces sp. R21 TaxID=3238627 RepID=A0AB39NXL0_9ACTN